MDKMKVQEQELRKLANFVNDNFVSSNTKLSYKYDLKVFTDYCKANNVSSLSEVNMLVVMKYFIESKANKSYSTLRRYTAAFLTVPHLKQFVTTDEFGKLMKSIENEADLTVKNSTPMKHIDVIRKVLQLKSLKYQFLFIVMFKGAFRISEMLNLKVDDISVEEQGLQITIRKSKTSNKPAKIGLRTMEIDVVEIWLEYKETLQDERVFPMCRSAVHRYIKNHLGEEYSSHSFRSGHVTRSLQKKVPIEIIQKTTRHRDVNVLLSHYYVPGSSFENSTDII